MSKKISHKVAIWKREDLGRPLTELEKIFAAHDISTDNLVEQENKLQNVRTGHDHSISEGTSSSVDSQPKHALSDRNHYNISGASSQSDMPAESFDQSNKSDWSCSSAPTRHPFETWIPMEDFEEIQIQRIYLPIYTLKKKLMSAFAQKDCFVFYGEAGCGKTTQIPQFILDGKFHNGRAIAITQPYDVAAVSIARRVAAEANTIVGKKVGYSIPFYDCTSIDTKIKYLTDEMLLQESIEDSLLMAYSWLILDDTHEQTVYTNALFGVAKSAQKKRIFLDLPALKVVIMSANIDKIKLNSYFNKPSFYHVHSENYPIEIHHVISIREDYVETAVSTVMFIHQNRDMGDILVFLASDKEVELAVLETKKLTRPYSPSRVKLVPWQLYASLPRDIFQAVLKPSLPNERKIIYSTDFAKLSFTIPGIRYVVDTGMTKSKTYNSRLNSTIEKVTRISRSEADQRSERAGHEAAGACYRLYTLEQFQSFLDFPIPEIQRSSLTGILLKVIAVGVSDVMNFEFLDRPSDESIQRAIQELKLLEAIEGNDSDLILTPIGKQMLKFPLDPRFSRAIIAAIEFKCTDEIITIISMLSVEYVFLAIIGETKDYIDIKKRYFSIEGDHMMLLNIFRDYQNATFKKGWCLKHYVKYKAMAKAEILRCHLSEVCREMRIPRSFCSTDISCLAKCLSRGFFMNLVQSHGDAIYETVKGNQRVCIHPTSSMLKSETRFLIYVDMVESSTFYMRNVLAVEKDWALEAAPGYFEN